MKKFLHSFWVLSCILCIVFYTPQQAHSNASGAPSGKSGSPGDNGSTCNSCHSGGSQSNSDYFEIISVGFPNEYIEGETYSFMVDMFTEDESSLYGFQLKAEDDFGNSVGELIITNPTNTQTVGGGNYITHTSTGTIGDVGAFWGFDWQAPNAFEGNVTFYAAGIIANANGQNSGDILMSTNLPIEISSTTIDVLGCTDPLAINYNPEATHDDASCVYDPCLGFDLDIDITNLSSSANSDGSATINTILGTAPFTYSWFSTNAGELTFTTSTASDLSEGTYTVFVTDAADCTQAHDFEIQVTPDVFITSTGAMTDIETCNGVLYDTGGPDGWYQTGENTLIRICPSEEGTSAQITFSQFHIMNNWGGAVFTIYDGMGNSGDILATLDDIELNTPITASESNSSGCLTIQFTAGWFAGEGWEANLSCFEYIIYGCMDDTAYNYDSTAEQDDESCYYAPGCTDATFVEYHSQGYLADFDDGSCTIPFVDDCTNPTAINYNPEATLNLEIDPCVYNLADWSCGMHYKDERDGQSYATVKIGDYCWMSENLNYTFSTTNTVPIENGVASQFDDGFIYTGIGGYSPDINGKYYTWGSAVDAVPYAWHLPSVQEFESLFIDFTALDLPMNEASGLNTQFSGCVTEDDEYLQFQNIGNSTWFWSTNELDEELASGLVLNHLSAVPTFEPIPRTYGLNIRAVFGFPEGTVLGCTDEDYIEYNDEATTDDGSCEIIAIEGCTDETALNFSEIATVDDDSCIPYIEGCTDDEYLEYDDEATVEDGTCEVIAVLGCIDETAQNFDDSANLDDGSCIAHVLGCTDDEFAEYNEEATLDDGSCATTAIFGCTDESAFNFNSAANVEDDSCLPYLEGCTDVNFIEFNGMANVDDGSCLIPVVFGCTIDYALNYNALANTDDGSCIVEGCTNELFVEYDVNATVDNGTCSIFAIWGCTDDLYLEFFPPANMDDNSCINLIVEGCTDPVYIEYSADANVDDGSCTNLALLGCTDENYLEYNPDAVVDNNTCETPEVLGCMDNLYLEYSVLANMDDGSCNTITVVGCTDDTFMEYNPLANLDDGSCTFIILYGCTDDNYTEYNPNANVENGSCFTPVILGCIDVLAFNYNEDANTDDGSCVPVVFGCLDPDYVEYNNLANTSDPSLCTELIVLGCTNEEAINYSSLANTDDGSCIMYLVELFSEGLANGGMQFSSTILGLGAEYELFWTFENGTTSSEPNPLVFFQENGTYEITLVVNTGEIEVTTSIFVDILNAPGIGIDELSNSKAVVSVLYYDLIGRIISEPKLLMNQVYIKKYTYIDGTSSHVKMIPTL